MKYVYLVWHDSPAGSWVVGVYSTLKKAETKKIKWDKEHSHSFDKATITKNKVN